MDALSEEQASASRLHSTIAEQECSLRKAERDLQLEKRHCDELLGRTPLDRLRKLRLLEVQRELRAGLDGITEEVARRMLDPKVKNGVWQWQTHDGTFQDYEPCAQAQIDEHLSLYPEGCEELVELTIQGFRVKIDFVEMEQQVVGGSGRRRSIRMADALHLQEPTWTFQKCTSQLVSVDSGTADYAKVLHVIGDLLRDHAVVSVFRVQNHFLIKKYNAERQNLIAHRGAENLAEMTLFHGTRHHDPHSIVLMREGFMVDHSSMGLLGKGIYFAENPCYSHLYAHYVDHADRTRHYTMLICRVLCGRVRKMGMGSDRLFTRLKLPPDEFDSVEGGPHNPPNGTLEDASVMHVVYQDSQVYPDFVVTYRNRYFGDLSPQPSSEAA